MLVAGGSGPVRYVKLVALLAAAMLSFATAFFALFDDAWVGRLYFSAMALAMATIGWYAVSSVPRSSPAIRAIESENARRGEISR